MFAHEKLVKKTLSNGLVVIVDPIKTLPKVALELMYNVGSKDEKYGEKGLAHLIEHMLFKGTDKLSEADLDLITHKLSGEANAYTSYDCTSYVFTFPSWNYKVGLSVLADTMVNARFDKQMLNSEMQAVIQELKMYKDQYAASMVDELMSIMFHDHPYHYPIIGFKQDLWNLERDTLYNFYKKHYIPNNAVLVVVGDVNPEEVFNETERLFGHIKPNFDYKKEEFYHGSDLISKSVTLYRDVSQPMLMLAWNLPGGRNHPEYVYDAIASLLASGKSSRLTQRIVDELQLASSVEAFYYHFDDASPFFIYVEPYDIESIETIKSIIHEEITNIIQEGLTQEEVETISRKIKVAMVSVLESYSKRASAIASGYTKMGDETYIFKYAQRSVNTVSKEIQEILSTYFSPSSLNQAMVLPLEDKDKQRWLELQELSDAEDARILEGRERTTELEEPRAALELKENKPHHFDFVKAEKTILSNGVKLFYYNNTALPTISFILSFKARPEYDSEELPGLYSFMTNMLLEGTKNYPGTLIAQEFEKYGMNVSMEPGYWTVTCLCEDLEKALELIHEVLAHVVFTQDNLEKIRDQLINSLKSFWDDPSHFIYQIIGQDLYKNHPYSKTTQGTFESLAAIRLDDVIQCYKAFITHDGMRISLVGNIAEYDVPLLFEKYIGSWKGKSLQKISYPSLQSFTSKTIVYPINRDQVVLAYACPSISRLDECYEQFLIFDQIFGGSSMSSKLFNLRQRSGLFYGIRGTLIAGSDEQPGMFLVQTMVSLDRLEEAERVIKQTIDTVVDTLTQEDVEDAKRVVIDAQINNFSNNKRMAATFLSLDRFQFPDNYFDTAAERISKITLADIKKSVKCLLDSSRLATYKAGRLEKE